MNLATKLILIQEGYSLNQISEITTFDSLITEEAIPYIEEINIITESIISDIDHMTNMTISIFMEDSSNQSAIRRFINWLIEKIRQFKIFIINLFRKRREEIRKTQVEILREKIKSIKNFKSFTIYDNFQRMLSDPKGAINALKEAIEKFEDTAVEFMDDAYKGYNDIITPETDINGLQAIIWKKVFNYFDVKEGQNITVSVIEKILGKSKIIRISSIEDIENIIDFMEGFYELWKDINDSLTYYEKQLSQLGSFSDDGFKIIKLICETLLQTIPDIFKCVDFHIRKLEVIQKHI